MVGRDSDSTSSVVAPCIERIRFIRDELHMSEILSPCRTFWHLY